MSIRQIYSAGRDVLRLAWPTFLVTIFQVITSAFDVWMAGQLGTAALGGLTLTFPFAMLMYMLAGGSIGGGIAAAVARATGRKSRLDAHDLATHGLIISLGLGVTFGVIFLLFGHRIIRILSESRSKGTEQAIEAAILYSKVLFPCGIVSWVMFAFSAIFRGLGNVAFPSRVMIYASLLQIPMCYVLTTGVGAASGLGILGIGLAPSLAHGIALVLMCRKLRRDFAGAAFVPTMTKLRWSFFREISRVGLISAMSVVLISATILLMTVLIGRHGVLALAGYGIAARLDYYLGPLTFGIGSSLTVLVGQAAGRNDWTGARHVALTGGGMAFILCGIVGVVVAVVPQVWVDVFTGDATVRAAAFEYLQRLGPTYAFFGLGQALAFALQGVARVGVVVLASAVRPIGIGMAVLAGLTPTLGQLYSIAAMVLILYGCILLIGFLVHSRSTDASSD